MNRNEAFRRINFASDLLENAETMLFYSMSAKKTGSFVETADKSIESAIKELEQARASLKRKS